MNVSLGGILRKECKEQKKNVSLSPPHESVLSSNEFDNGGFKCPNHQTAVTEQEQIIHNSLPDSQNTGDKKGKPTKGSSF